MSSRIYLAKDSTGTVERLVFAAHPSAAVRHCFSAQIATQHDLVRLIEAGVRVERAQGSEPVPQVAPAAMV